MYEHASLLNVPVLAGVGAAFDIHSGEDEAPEWMRERGLEWLFRLLQEPVGFGGATSSMAASLSSASL